MTPVKPRRSSEVVVALKKAGEEDLDAKAARVHENAGIFFFLFFPAISCHLVRGKLEAEN